MANICQDDFEVARPDSYFPLTMRQGKCDACGEDNLFVARVTEEEAAKVRAQREAEKPAFDLVTNIMRYENGFLTDRETLTLFSVLIQTGMAWRLQGFYGRNARALIEAGLITEDGTITEKGNDL